MKKITVLVTAILSIVITILSPFIFDVYLQTKPTSSTFSFGAPFPFISENIAIPQNAKFPFKLDFHFIPLQNMTFHSISFLLSFIAIFILVISITATLLRFFKKEHKVR